MAGKSTITQTGGFIEGVPKEALIVGGIVAFILIVVVAMYLMKVGPFKEENEPTEGPPSE
jgi:hypothetical protein